MAHQEQKDFCLKVKNNHPIFFNNKNVLDVGSLDINGNNRYLFENCIIFGIDVGHGKNVDHVCKAHEFKTETRYDVIISTECFEHDMFYDKTLNNIINLLEAGGMFIFTCATEGRAEHGTRRTTPCDAPLLSQYNDWQDYYKNLTEQDIRNVLTVDDIFSEYEFEINHISHDLYFWGIKK